MRVIMCLELIPLAHMKRLLVMKTKRSYLSIHITVCNVASFHGTTYLTLQHTCVTTHLMTQYNTY